MDDNFVTDGVGLYCMTCGEFHQGDCSLEEAKLPIDLPLDTETVEQDKGARAKYLWQDFKEWVAEWIMFWGSLLLITAFVVMVIGFLGGGGPGW